MRRLLPRSVCEFCKTRRPETMVRAEDVLDSDEELVVLAKSVELLQLSNWGETNWEGIGRKLGRFTGQTPLGRGNKSEVGRSGGRRSTSFWRFDVFRTESDTGKFSDASSAVSNLFLVISYPGGVSSGLDEPSCFAECSKAVSSFPMATFLPPDKEFLGEKSVWLGDFKLFPSGTSLLITEAPAAGHSGSSVELLLGFIRHFGGWLSRKLIPPYRCEWINLGTRETKTEEWTGGKYVVTTIELGTVIKKHEIQMTLSKGDNINNNSNSYWKSVRRDYQQVGL